MSKTNVSIQKITLAKQNELGLPKLGDSEVKQTGSILKPGKRNWVIPKLGNCEAPENWFYF